LVRRDDPLIEKEFRGFTLAIRNSIIVGKRVKTKEAQYGAS
jgi:hypothetical protein